MPAAINIHRGEERRLRGLLKELADVAGPVQLGIVVESFGEKMELSDLANLAVLKSRDATKHTATEEDDDHE